ncbi:MAG: protein translocase subunit SecD [Gemmataceae bacterium]|nr:protein translocase subunit SecD [Gemmataceae bacterium]
MQRNYLRGLLVCLVPCLVAGYFAARLDKYKLGIDLAGGTILVYEINTERTRQLEAAREATGQAPKKPAAGAPAGLSGEDMVKLAAQIKRRIDPADLKNVTVRPLGDRRIEIILPTAGAGAGGRSNLSEEEIAEVKSLVSQMGVLEFRILANNADDQRGIQAAKDVIDSPEYQDRLKQAAAAGLAPPGPEGTFPVWVNEDEDEKRSGATPQVKYMWVELGPEERETLGLSNKYASGLAADGKGQLYPLLAAARGKTYLHEYPAGDENARRQTSMLLYSREVDPRSPQAQKEQAELARLKAEGKEDQFHPKQVEYFVLTRVSEADTVRVEGEVSLSAKGDVDPKTFKPSVSFVFNGAGARAFGKMTSRNKPDKNTGGGIRVLAIVLDDKVVSAPSLNAVISSHGQISGNFDQKSVDRLVNFLRNGALNAQLREKPVSENTIGPTLGADTIRKGTMAVGAAFVAVLAFMLVYYRFAGFVACVALLANLLLTVGFMVGVNAAFTLPGLAGIVLMLGMAVDANVLIYERLREERNKGANIATAIRNGYDRAFPTIIDTHLTSIFTAVILYTFGNDNLKGFSVSLTVGLVISLFTSLYMTRLMFDYWMHRRWLTNLRMMRLFEQPTFNPMKYRFHFFIATTILTVAGLGLFLLRGEDVLNVDFRGGTVYAGKLKDGEERALTAVGDKPGFRELLSEESQKKRLNATDVRWLNEPADKDAAQLLGTYIFEITYDDGARSTVGLTENPAGASFDKEQMKKALLARARVLPDVSVEQMFMSEEAKPADGKSRYFTLRTTERQPDLVRVSIDRLFRTGEGASAKSIIAGTTMGVGPVTGPVVELTFPEPGASVAQVRELLDSQFKNAGADDGPNSFALEPDKTSEVSGRYRRMTLGVKSNTKLAALNNVYLAPLTGTAVQAEGYVAAETLQRILAETKTAFETRPEPIRLEVFDSQLASETRTKAFGAILASWLAILVYLWFRFGNWTFGLAAVLCLVHDLCFTLGAIAACVYLYDSPIGLALGIHDFKIDLIAVAALLTLVGYSVSDTIVVFDRIREVRGKNPALTAQMINDSVNQTLSRTILAAATVFLVSIVLYVAGGEGVHLFAFVMVMGVLVGTYSSIFVASPLLLMFGEGKHADVSPAEVEGPKEEQEETVEG